MDPVTCLMTHSLYPVLNYKSLWCQILVLMPEARDELLLWKRQRSSAVRVVNSEMLAVKYSGQITNRQWTEQEAQQSSAWHELRAVRLVLQLFATKLAAKGCVSLLITKMLLGYYCVRTKSHF